jgi:hypothetical protein
MLNAKAKKQTAGPAYQKLVQDCRAAPGNKSKWSGVGAAVTGGITIIGVIALVVVIIIVGAFGIKIWWE